MAMDMSQRECALGYSRGRVCEGNPREWAHLTMLRECPPPPREWCPALSWELRWVLSTSAARERSAPGAPSASCRALGAFLRLLTSSGVGTYDSLCIPRSSEVKGSELPPVVVKVRVLSLSLCHPVLGIIQNLRGSFCTPLVSNSVTPIRIADSTCGPPVHSRGGPAGSGVRLRAVILLLPMRSLPRHISSPTPNLRD